MNRLAASKANRAAKSPEWGTTWRNHGGHVCGFLLAVAALVCFAVWPASAGSGQKAGGGSAAAKPRSAKAAEAAPRAAAESGDAARGKKLFNSDGCFECHGHAGEGSVMTGPRLAPDPVPFSDFAKELRHPINQMPPYTAKVVSQQDLRDIYAFLKSIPKPPRVQSIRELQ